MKNIIFLIFVLLVIWSCSPSHKAMSSDRQLTIKSDSAIESDSVEYEIIIIDTKFENWYLIHFSQAKDYSNEYYRSKNQVAAGTWNEYYTRGRYHNVIENHIYYDNSVDYGIEVNRRLYWYFKYTEETFKIRLFN